MISYGAGDNLAERQKQSNRSRLLIRTTEAALACSIAIGAIMPLQLKGSQIQEPKDTSSPLSLRVASEDNYAWSGYITKYGTGKDNPEPLLKGISATWTVPSQKLTYCSNTGTPVEPTKGTARFSQWIGIGGEDGGKSLIQIGTVIDYTSKPENYYAFYELVPDKISERRITKLHIRPSDTVSAEVVLKDPKKNVWTLCIDDITSNEHFKKNTKFSPDRTTADWMAESGNFMDSDWMTLKPGFAFHNAKALIGERYEDLRLLNPIKIRTIPWRKDKPILAFPSDISQDSSFSINYLENCTDLK